MREQRPKLSRGTDLARAMDYMLKRWTSFSRFLEDGRICLSNNAAERALRGIALGRKSWLFAGSDRGGQRAAAMYSLIVKAKLNDVDPQAWLADVLSRIAEHPVPEARRASPVELAAAPGRLQQGHLTKLPKQECSAALHAQRRARCGPHRMLTVDLPELLLKMHARTGFARSSPMPAKAAHGPTGGAFWSSPTAEGRHQLARVVFHGKRGDWRSRRGPLEPSHYGWAVEARLTPPEGVILPRPR